MDDKAKALLSEMSRGVQLAFHNAEELFIAAELLREKGHAARALLLHQISLEECGKIEIIGGWAMHLFLDGQVDLDKMTSAFRSHKAKNYANAYFAEASPEELEARKSGDSKVAVDAFKKLQENFHKDSNDAKNASLYVDFKDGKFVAPEEIITPEMAKGIAAVNHYFLGLTAPKVRMMENLLKDTGALKNTLSWMVEEVEKMKGDKTPDPSAAMEGLMEEMFERFKKEIGDHKK